MPSTAGQKGLRSGYIHGEEGWDAELNETIRQADAGIPLGFQQNRATSIGLNYGYFGGPVPPGGTFVPAGTVLLAANTTNLVERTVQGAVSVTTGSFSLDKIPMAVVVTNSSNITSVTDYRPVAWRLADGTLTPYTAVKFIGSASKLVQSPAGLVVRNSADNTNLLALSEAGDLTLVRDVLGARDVVASRNFIGDGSLLVNLQAPQVVHTKVTIADNAAGFTPDLNAGDLYAYATSTYVNVSVGAALNPAVGRELTLILKNTGTVSSITPVFNGIYRRVNNPINPGLAGIYTFIYDGSVWYAKSQTVL